MWPLLTPVPQPKARQCRGDGAELPFPGGAVNSSSSVPKRIFKQLPQQQFLLPGQEQPLGRGAGPFPCDGSRELQCRSPSSPAGFSPQRLFVYFGLLGFCFFFFSNFIEGRTFLSGTEIATKQKSSPNRIMWHHLLKLPGVGMPR